MKWVNALACSTALALCACGEVDRSPVPAAPPAAIGEAVQVEGLEFVITAVEERQSVGADFMAERASEGGTLVVVSWSLKNNRTAPMEFYDEPKMHLVDAGGVMYSSDLEKTSAYASEADLSEKMFSDLNPGVTVRGADVYEVASASFDRATWFINIDGGDRQVALAAPVAPAN